jgi:hypothetical protein
MILVPRQDKVAVLLCAPPSREIYLARHERGELHASRARPSPVAAAARRGMCPAREQSPRAAKEARFMRPRRRRLKNLTAARSRSQRSRAQSSRAAAARARATLAGAARACPARTTLPERARAARSRRRLCPARGGGAEGRPAGRPPTNGRPNELDCGRPGEFKKPPTGGDGGGRPH